MSARPTFRKQLPRFNISRITQKMVDQRSPKRRRTLDPSENTTSARPSYGAPTRASLSRYNPRLLPEARSSPVRKSPGKAGPMADDLLSHVLGGKAKKPIADVPKPTRASVGGANDDNPVSEPNDENSRMENEEGIEDAEVEETINAEFETPTIEGGRFRNRDELDDLPETPQHLRENPEYQDTPPRGILHRSLKKARAKSRRSSRQTSRQTSPAEKVDGENGEIATEKPAVPQLTLEDRVQLKKKQEDLAVLKEELRKLKSDTFGLEQHANALGKLQIGQEYDKLTNLITMINRSNLARGKENGDVNFLPVSTLLTSYLPFSIPLQETPSSVDDDTPVPSHAPLPDTPRLLNLFTPFNTTSILSPPSKPSKTESQITQLHTITLTIASFFSCTLAMTVASTPGKDERPTVSNIDISHLSPWAEREVGAWARARALEGDIHGIGYGLGRYWELNIKRAQVWTRIMSDYSHLNPRAVGILSDLDQQQDAKSNGKRKRSDGELDVEQLAKYLGRDVLICGDGVCEMRIHWSLGFDWTSEIESKVNLRLTFSKRGKSLHFHTLRPPY
jgi:hypothetical protein